MLAADKAALESELKRKALEIQDKELNFFVTNFGSIATQVRFPLLFTPLAAATMLAVEMATTAGGDDDLAAAAAVSYCCAAAAAATTAAAAAAAPASASECGVLSTAPMRCARRRQ